MIVSRVLRRIVAWFRSRRLDRDYADEARFHLEMEQSKHQAAGVPAAEAAALARRSFGSGMVAREEVRDAHGLMWWDDVTRDVAGSVRGMRRSPGFYAIVTLTLALGIGLNTVIMTAVDAILLRPVSYIDAEHVVELWVRPAVGGPDRPLTYGGWEIWQPQSSVFAATGAYDQAGVEYSGPNESAILNAIHVTPDYLKLVGAPAIRGRLFGADDFDKAPPPVVIVSYGFWRSQLASAPNVIGTFVLLGRVPHTIVGVMPPDLSYPRRGTQIWLPMRGPANHEQVVALARIRTDRASVQPSVDRLAASLKKEHPDLWRGPIVLVPIGLHRANLDIAAGLKVLAAAVLAVLLIACGNAANLLLFRGATKDREYAMRMALGATRFRLFRQVLIESILVATLGAVSGLTLAAVGVNLLAAAIPMDFTWQSFHDVALSSRTLLFTLIVSVGTGLLCGIVPALRAGRAQGHLFRFGALGVVRSRPTGSARTVAIVTELALSTGLVLGAAVFVHSFAKLAAVSPGIDVERLAVLDFQFSDRRYADSTSRRRFVRALDERIRRIPSVVDVSFTGGMPPRGGGFMFADTIMVDGDRTPSGKGPAMFPSTYVPPNYFHAVGTPILLGRGFIDADARDSANPTVIDRDFATWLWPSQSPIGRRFRFSRGEPWNTVVGIAGDTKLMGPDDRAGPFEIYYPIEPDRMSYQSVAIRTNGDPRGLLNDVRRSMRDVDPLQPIVYLSTAEDRFSESIHRQRFLTQLITGFGGVALVLALIGLYGVVAYSVSGRTAEFGIRMALGATRKGIQRLVLSQGVLLIVTGVAIGVVIAAIGTRFMGSLLFGVSPLDPLAFGLVPLGLAAAALAACAIPARRASRADPMSSLRVD